MDQKKTGAFLKELRREKGITQTDLAALVGVTNRSVSRWENGATMPDLDVLVQLACYYEVEVGEILEGERRAPGAAIEPEKTLLQAVDRHDEERCALLHRMRALFAVALVGMVAYAAIDIAGLSDTEPYEAVVTIALGFATGTLLTGMLYTTQLSRRIQLKKARMVKRLRA